MDIDNEDVNIMFMFLDLDGSNSIEYNEFLRKLRRAGVKIRRSEEQCLFDIYTIITKEGLTLREVYEAFDKNGDNQVTKEEMAQTFRQLSMNVDKAQIDYMFQVADISGDGEISFDEFKRLFENIVREQIREANQGQSQQLDWKKQVML